MLRVIDRYVMRRVAGVMLATMAGGCLLLSLARMLLFVQSGASFAREFPILVKLTVLFLPHYLGFMLPLSLFWGTYSVVRRLSLNSELTSLLASGMSLTRFNRPLLVLGIAATALNIGVLGWMEPWARYVYREIRFHVENVSPYLAATEGQFMKIGEQTLLVEHIDKALGHFSKIFLFEAKDNGTTTEILAEKGRVVTSDGRVALLLENGTRLTIKPQPHGRIPSPEYVDFETLTFPLTSEQKIFRPMGDDEQELSLLSLYRLSGTPPPGTVQQEMSSELNRKLVIILSSLFLPLLATSFARSNLRGRNAFQGITAFGFLIAYQQIVQFGSLLTDHTGASPVLTIWPVFFLLVIAAVSLLVIQDTRSGMPMERMSLMTAKAWRNVRTWFEPAPPRRRRRRVSHPHRRPLSR